MRLRFFTGTLVGVLMIDASVARWASEACDQGIAVWNFDAVFLK